MSTPAKNRLAKSTSSRAMRNSISKVNNPSVGDSSKPKADSKKKLERTGSTGHIGEADGKDAEKERIKKDAEKERIKKDLEKFKEESDVKTSKKTRKSTSGTKKKEKTDSSDNLKEAEPGKKEVKKEPKKEGDIKKEGEVKKDGEMKDDTKEGDTKEGDTKEGDTDTKKERKKEKKEKKGSNSSLADMAESSVSLTEAQEVSTSMSSLPTAVVEDESGEKRKSVEVEVKEVAVEAKKGEVKIELSGEEDAKQDGPRMAVPKMGDEGVKKGAVRKGPKGSALDAPEKTRLSGFRQTSTTRVGSNSAMTATGTVMSMDEAVAMTLRLVDSVENLSLSASKPTNTEARNVIRELTKNVREIFAQ